MRDFTAVLWFVVGLYSAARGPLVLYSTTQPRTTVICLSVCLAENGSPSYGSSANVFVLFLLGSALSLLSGFKCSKAVFLQ